YAAGGRAIMLAQEAVGVQGLFTAHPLARVITDLSVYLRQPAPDAQRIQVGAAVAAHVLTPTL
ncbi:acyl-CoA dehydrogenase, partial [Sphingomonas sp. NPDC019816]